METEVRPPDAPLTEPPPPPNRRWPLRVAVVVGVMLLVVFLLGGLFILRYDPVVEGSSSFNVTGPVSTHRRDLKIFGVADVVSWRVHVHKGDTFGYAFSIRNDGRVGITVDAIGLPANEQSNFAATRTPVAVQTGVGSPDPGKRQVFHPFGLAPGEEAVVWMKVTVNRCIGQGAALGWNLEDLTFSVLGIHRHIVFAPGIQIDLADAPGVVCRA